MERGIVRSFEKNSGMGMIGRASNVDVRFFSRGVIGKSQNNLMQGDSVMFEVENIANCHTAINVRKCT